MSYLNNKLNNLMALEYILILDQSNVENQHTKNINICHHQCIISNVNNNIHRHY